MSKYEFIAFDLDGTLTDPQRGLIESFSYGLSKMGVDFGDKASLVRFIGPPLYDDWRREFGFSAAEADRALRLFREYYSVYGWWDNEVYPGIPEMLSALKDAGKIICVSTSKPEVFARKIISHFSLDNYFEFVGGAANENTRDKKWEVLEYSLDAVGCRDLSSAILVGDRKFDAEGAKKVGVSSLGVTWGHGSRSEILEAGFDHIAESTDEVLRILLN